MKDSTRYTRRMRRPRFESLESRRLLSITVNTLVDENDGVGVGTGTSLREAIAAAVSGDTIDFSVTGVIEVTSTLTVDKSLSINGPGAGLLTIRAFDPTPATKNGDGIRIFRMGDSDMMNILDNSISGLTLTGADVSFEGGGAIWTSENLTVSDCVLSNNRSGQSPNEVFGGGGAIQSIAVTGYLTVAPTALTIRNSTLSGNSVPIGEGGAIRKRGGSLLVEDCTISDNSASHGGGFAASDQSIDVRVNRTHITNNRLSSTVAGYGGGIFVTGGTLAVADSEITGNTAPGGGGGIRTNSSVMLTDTVISNNSTTSSSGQGGGVWARYSVDATRCTISNNTALGSGGGVYARNPTLRDCTISSNSGSSGGGVAASSLAVVTRCTISDNSTTSSVGWGGGISAGGLNISDSTVRGNKAAQGGGISSGGSSTNPVIVDRCTISDNTATSTGSQSTVFGGGISCTYLKMTASTVSGNLAVRAGGIMSQGGVITNSTISGNTATTFAGALAMSGTVVSSTITANVSPAATPGAVQNATLRSSILAGNTNGDAGQTALSQGYNIVGITVVPSFNKPGDQTGITNPMLGPLAANGGPTKTHLPLAGSPTIDAGDPAAVAGVNGVLGYDQRGKPYARVWNGDGMGAARIDVGAVEVQTLPLPQTVYGDYNADGVADAGDYVLWRKMTPATVTPYTGADGSGNGSVGAEDYYVWRAYYGETRAAASRASGEQLAASSVVANGSEKVDDVEAAAAAPSVSSVGTSVVGDVAQPTRVRTGAPVLAKRAAVGAARADALVEWARLRGETRDDRRNAREWMFDESDESAEAVGCAELDAALGELMGDAVLSDGGWIRKNSENNHQV